MLDDVKKWLESPTGLLVSGAVIGIAGTKAADEGLSYCKRNGWLWYDKPKSKGKGKSKRSRSSGGSSSRSRPKPTPVE